MRNTWCALLTVLLLLQQRHFFKTIHEVNSTMLVFLADISPHICFYKYIQTGTGRMAHLLPTLTGT